MKRVQVLRGHLAAQHGTEPAHAGVDTQETSSSVLDAYDYVIVGAGSAGCVLASRLSENANVSVLLLEAGGSNQNYRVRSPLLMVPRLQNSELDWAFRTEPQEHTANRVSYQPRGKMLGGCSSINYMLAVRGDPKNYDQWAAEHGCEGWSYKDVLPYFKKSENLICSNAHKVKFEDNIRGRAGLLPVTDSSDPTMTYSSKGAIDRFLQGCEECGIPRNDDYNGPVQDGVGPTQATVHNGVRCDAASCFLIRNKAIERSNLTVATFAHVMQVVVQGDRAVGVTFKQGNYDRETLRSSKVPSRFVRAKREVIMCAGAYNTPQILQLSGIGPRDHLESKGIPVHADLPGVGSELQDHLMVPLFYPVKDKYEHTTLGPFQVLKELFNFAFLSQGIFMLPFIMALAFFRSGVRKEEDGNDLQIHFVPYVDNDRELANKNIGYNPEENPRHTLTLEKPKGLLFLPSLIRPKSTGFVRLKSSDPFEDPLIDPRYLSEPDDMEALVRAYKKCREIAETSSTLRSFLGTRMLNPFSKYDPESDEYVLEHIRDEVMTIYHPTSTCKMGPSDDPMTVVDPATLKVKGFSNLRVADASIAPYVVSGNTNLMAIMIGEKAADIIRKDQQATK